MKAARGIVKFSLRVEGQVPLGRAATLAGGVAAAGVAGNDVYQTWMANARDMKGVVEQTSNISVENAKPGSLLLECSSTANAFMALSDDLASGSKSALAIALSQAMKVQVSISVEAVTDGFQLLHVAYLRDEAKRRGLEMSDSKKAVLIEFLEKPLKRQEKKVVQGTCVSQVHSPFPQVDPVKREREEPQTLKELSESLLVDIPLDVSERSRSEFSAVIDVLVLVVNDEEKQAALRFCTLTSKISWQSYNYFHGWFTNLPDISLVLVQQPEQGSLGHGKAQSVVTQALSIWHPRFVCAVGVAFGLDPQCHTLLDVLVSTAILPYEWVREGKDRQSRNRLQLVPRDVLKLFEGVGTNSSTWHLAKDKSPMGTLTCHVHKGIVLCGEKLMDNAQKKAELKSLLDVDDKGKILNMPVIGGEMEGFGMWSACEEHRGLPCIIVKGVCDFGEEKQALHEDPRAKRLLQRQAAYAAFSVLEHVLATNSTSLPSHFIPQQANVNTMPKYPVVIDTTDPQFLYCKALIDAQKAVDSARVQRVLAVEQLRSDPNFSIKLESARNQFETASSELKKLEALVDESIDPPSA